jgi:GT2 family glycosyltransferase
LTGSEWPSATLAEVERLAKTLQETEIELSEELAELLNRIERIGEERTSEIDALRADCAGALRFAEEAASLETMLWESKPWKAYCQLGRMRRAAAGGSRKAALFPKRLWRRARIRASTKRHFQDVGLAFESVDQPLVSIVTTLGDQLGGTARCLESLWRSRVRTPFEVMAVNTSGHDEVIEVVRGIPNVQCLEERGAGGASVLWERVGETARGEYLVFLGADAVVNDAWLDSLVDIFIQYPQAGMAGPILLREDGRVDQAGGLVRRDGSMWKCGVSAELGAPEYSYVRDVDYCPATCFAVRRSLFLELGGFADYVPGVYGEIDLAFRARRAGWRVLFQPHAAVARFPLSDDDASLGAVPAELELSERRRFVESWNNELAKHRPAGGFEDLEKERAIRFRMLILDHHLPTPDRDSGSLRMFNLIRILQDLGVKVSFLPQDLGAPQPYARDLQASGVEVLHTPHVTSIDAHLRAHGHLYQGVILSRLHVAWSAFDSVRRYCPAAKVIFDTVDLCSVRLKRRAAVEDDGDSEDADVLESREVDLSRSADLTLAVSAEEREIIEKASPGAEVSVISNIHEVFDPETPFEQRKDILFIGGFEHTPNVAAATWLVADILPLIKERIPDVRLFVIGSSPPKEVVALGSDDVEITGYVRDVRSFFEACKLSVAPLTYGAGVKGKVNQSMALGLPCVATSVAVEGMSLEHERNVMVADSASAFAECVARVYEDEELWTRLSHGGLENVRHHFSFGAAREAVKRALPELA